MDERHNTRDPAETQRVSSDPGIAQTVAHYALQREIGRGGMSSVYEAEDTRTGNHFALKLLTLPPSLAAGEKSTLIARFEREARIIAHLSHPNIVDIHEVGSQEGQHFLAMEYLQGETLRERMTRERLTPEAAQEVLRQIGGAIDAVHAAGIVHRDIKPTNIMLLPDGTAKLLDFGIARSSDETTITSTGILVGSPSYLSPEQIKGEAGATATDLWALGVLAYEMLAGHPPFAGQTVANVLYQITNESPARTPGLSVAVQRVLRRALDRNPARRFLTAEALVSALGAALSEVPGRPQTLAAPPQQRSVPLWLPGAVLLLLFLTGFSWTVLQHPPAKALVRVPPQTARGPIAPKNTPVPLIETHRPLIEMHQPRVTRAVYPKYAAARSKPRLIVLVLTAPQAKPRLRKFHRIAAVPKRVIRTQEPTGRSIAHLALPDPSDGVDPEADAQRRKIDWVRSSSDL